MFKLFNLSLLLLCAAALNAAPGKSYHEDPAKYWDFSKLEKVPAYRDSGFPECKAPGVQDILFEGVPRKDKGKPTQVFAYIAYPETPMPAGGYPGILLVHGGGGTAYPEYTKLWASKGFAVLAIDWYNSRPDLKVIASKARFKTVKDKNGKIQKVKVENKIPLEGNAPLNDISTNVANMVLAHSLLRSLPKVNKEKTVFVGLSWGSWYGATVAALDPRFKGAVEIYCGDVKLDKNGKQRRNARFFVNGYFVHAAKIPMYWVCSTNDANIKFSSLTRSWEDCPKLVTKSLVIRLPHSHIGFTFPSCFRMAKHFALGEPALPVLGKAVVKDGSASVDIVSEGKGIKETIFCYTTDKQDVKFRYRKWQSIPAQRKGKTLTVKLPEGIFQGFFSAYDEKSSFNDCCGSSNVLFFGKDE